MADDADDGVLWVRKDAFVMPLLPPDLGVDRWWPPCSTSPRSWSCPGTTRWTRTGRSRPWSTSATTWKQLPPDRIEAVREQLGRVRKFARKNKWGKDTVEFFAEYLENVGLGVDE